MEISTMEGAKENCERAMESLVTPYDIIVENMAVREERRAYEVIRKTKLVKTENLFSMFLQLRL